LARARTNRGKPLNFGDEPVTLRDERLIFREEPVTVEHA
jgi:hypothetical protein